MTGYGSPAAQPHPKRYKLLESREHSALILLESFFNEEQRLLVQVVQVDWKSKVQSQSSHSAIRWGKVQQIFPAGLTSDSSESYALLSVASDGREKVIFCKNKQTKKNTRSHCATVCWWKPRQLPANKPSYRLMQSQYLLSKI